MKHLLTIILILAGLGGIVSAATDLRETEDRAAAGEPCAIHALRDSAEAGSLRAMNFLGFLYWQGAGTRLDRDSALYYLRLASERGDAKASANLGHLLLTGSPEMKADTVEALRLLDFAAGRNSSAALRELADYFDTNPGDSAAAGAIKKVADAYSHGFILPYNYHKSLKLYERAANLGDTTSRRIITELLEFFPDALRQ
ncbi:MAG: sel1 repeat family protein [Bacteroidales bacterium]|nr:sel1 repeat family protein [Bacteroidales bacterium]